MRLGGTKLFYAIEVNTKSGCKVKWIKCNLSKQIFFSHQFVIMWSEIIRIFLTVLLSIAFLILFGGNNIKRYLERNIGKISDEEFMKQEDIPVPGDTFAIAL